MSGILFIALEIDEFFRAFFFCMTEDQKQMKLALRLAKKGIGWVNPNPMVGAVIVKNGEVIGRGNHEFYGGLHAEANAINACTRSPRGATMYITLEPCFHKGKTPPCVKLIVERGIKRVVIAMPDPNPKVKGRGIEFLKSNKVKVETGILEEEASLLNESFIKFIQTRKPFCLYKGAMTLDGKIASVTGDSRWISGEASRKLAHQLRQQYSAIMVGVGTILKDNPTLDTRRSHKISKDPLKVVVDSMARISLDAQVLTNNPHLTLVAVTRKAKKAKIAEIRKTGAQVVLCPEAQDQVDLKYLILALGSMDIDSVLLEGGGTLAFSAIRDGVVDKVLFFVAPEFIGGKKAPTILEGDGIRRLSDAIHLNKISVKMLKEDIVIEGYLPCSQES